MKEGSTVGYKYFEFDGNEKMITLTYKCDSHAVIEVRSDSENGEKCATVNLLPSAEWTSETTRFICRGGINALYFTYRGNGMASLLEFEIG
jgi:hypothetical protein